MIFLIHGDDLAASRTFTKDLLQKYPDVVTFSGDTLSLAELTQALEGSSLFASDNVVVIENLLSNKLPKAELETVITLLINHSETRIILWEKSTLTKKQTSLFPKVDAKEFKLPQALFGFLDALRPTNPQLLLLFHQTQQNTETEVVFYMLVRHIRILLALSDTTSDSIDEIKRLAPWQKTKLEKQSALFSNESLLRVHTKLYAIEKGYKTGTIPSLEQAIDILLLEL